MPSVGSSLKFLQYETGIAMHPRSGNNCRNGSVIFQRNSIAPSKQHTNRTTRRFRGSVVSPREIIIGKTNLIITMRTRSRMNGFLIFHRGVTRLDTGRNIISIAVFVPFPLFPLEWIGGPLLSSSSNWMVSQVVGQSSLASVGEALAKGNDVLAKRVNITAITLSDWERFARASAPGVGKGCCFARSTYWWLLCTSPKLLSANKTEFPISNSVQSGQCDPVPR